MYVYIYIYIYIYIHTYCIHIHTYRGIREGRWRFSLHGSSARLRNISVPVEASLADSGSTSKIWSCHLGQLCLMSSPSGCFRGRRWGKVGTDGVPSFQLRGQKFPPPCEGVRRMWERGHWSVSESRARSGLCLAPGLAPVLAQYALTAAAATTLEGTKGVPSNGSRK